MIYTFNPLADPRWPPFVERHPRASLFHGRGWLEALQRTYDYEPVAYSTCSPSAALTNAIVFCQVDSWLTGRRLVSVPFADHCEPLTDDSRDLASLSVAMKQTVERRSAKRMKYVELRPLNAEPWAMLGATNAETFVFHALDLRPSLDEIYQRAHRSAIQQSIRRAQREQLTYESGNSSRLLSAFYRLMILTRRRHDLPPQPIRWFKNLGAMLRNEFAIRVAFRADRPIAALLTLSWGKTLVYKYSCSDAEYHHLGAVPFLLWNAIQEAKYRGFERFDFGRSDSDNPGLITFKTRWGAIPSELRYVRYGGLQSPHSGRLAASGILRYILARAPDRLLTTTGNLLYRHMA